MKKQEEILAKLQDSGLSFCISNPLQEGTFTFKAESIPTKEQKYDIAAIIDEECGCIYSWDKNWLTLYPEIGSNVFSQFQMILDKICNNKGIAYKRPPFIHEQEGLSAQQFLIKIAFRQPQKRKTFNKICWAFQLETGIYCELVEGNEILIDCQAPVDKGAIIAFFREEKQKKRYADECGRLARALNLPFINVLAIGTDEDLLERHQLTLERAAGLIAAQDKIEKKLLYFQLFKGDKENKEKAVKSLGIEIGDADVMRLDFSMLLEAFK